MSILRDRGTYERFVWQAYNFFHEQLSWENAVSEFEVAVQELLGASAPTWQTSNVDSGSL